MAFCDSFLKTPDVWSNQVALLHSVDYFLGVDSCYGHLADLLKSKGVIFYQSKYVSRDWFPQYGKSLVPINWENNIIIEDVYNKLQY